MVKGVWGRVSFTQPGFPAKRRETGRKREFQAFFLPGTVDYRFRGGRPPYGVGGSFAGQLARMSMHVAVAPFFGF